MIKKIFNALILLLISYTLTAQDNKPNIIYIYADDLGYGELGCYGQTKIQTPNIDRLAREGMKFTQHYSGAPVCAPSRCMLMTGKHAGKSYIRGNYELGGFEDDKEGGQMPLAENTYTISAMLKERGYTTALIGKWGLGGPGTTGSPLKQGFDYYYGYLDQKQAHNHYPTHLWENDRWDTLNNHYIYVHKGLDPKTATNKDFDFFKGNDYAPKKMTEKALGFIENNKHSPFFLYLPYTLPHLSLQAPEEYVNKYIGKFNEEPYFGNNGYAATKYPLSTYAAMITYLDDQVGIIMKKIKQLGLDDNTIIMFSSDNGATFTGGVDTEFFNSAGGLKGYKMDVYEGGIRVPFIVRWPGKIKANTVTDHLSVQYDIMPTIAALTGKKIINTDGISLLPIFLGKENEQKKHSFLYFEYPENGGQVAVRMGDWKGVRRDIRNNPQSPWELYDLSNDRFEKNNQSSLSPMIMKEIESIANREHTHPHILEWEFIDPKKK